jgi:hypothetical protein
MKIVLEGTSLRNYLGRKERFAQQVQKTGGFELKKNCCVMVR